MKKYTYDVAGIGSPLLDFTVEVDDAFLKSLGLTKGQMHLIDENKSKDIFDKIKNLDIQKTPGGSAANTLAGISNIGGKTILFGNVGSDANAQYYINETEKAGVKTALGKDSRMTGHAITFITPDSERTFGTHLGAAISFRKKDVNSTEIANSKILHIEGYLLEIPEIREAVIYAMQIAKENKVKISLDLADPGLVQRIHDVLPDIVKNYTDIIFANEDEAKAFTGKEGVCALEEIYTMCETAIVKLGKKGSLIKCDNTVCEIDAGEAKVVNTNGAGDVYAAGILYGIAYNIPIERAGRIAKHLACLVISQSGARLNHNVDISKI